MWLSLSQLWLSHDVYLYKCVCVCVGKLEAKLSMRVFFWPNFYRSCSLWLCPHKMATYGTHKACVCVCVCVCVRVCVCMCVCEKLNCAIWNKKLTWLKQFQITVSQRSLLLLLILLKVHWVNGACVVLIVNISGTRFNLFIIYTVPHSLYF